MNIWDIVITFAIAAVLFFAIRAVGKRRKNGSSCGCGCADCSAPCAYRTSGPKDPPDEKD